MRGAGWGVQGAGWGVQGAACRVLSVGFYHQGIFGNCIVLLQALVRFLLPMEKL